MSIVAYFLILYDVLCDVMTFFTYSLKFDAMTYCLILKHDFFYFLGAYLLDIGLPLLFSCQHDQLVGGCSDRLKKRGLRLRHGPGHGQAKKGGSYS